MSSVSSLQKNKGVRLAFSILVASLTCVFLAFCVRLSDADDDWCISLMLSNRLPQTGLSLFLNAALCQLIHLFNTVIPSINWFYIAEDVTAWFATVALVWTAFSFCSLGSAAVLLGFSFLCLLPYCIAQSNFTYVAGYAVLVGSFMLVCHIGQEDVGLIERFASGFLLLLGFMWRSQMLLMMLPFAVIAVAWKLFAQKGAHSAKEFIELCLKRLAPAVFALLVCAAFMVYDACMWSGREWGDWRSYNDARASYQDYTIPEYDEVKDQVTSLGLSENDYALLVNWAGSDTNVFDEKVFGQLADLFADISKPSASLIASIVDYGRDFVANKTLVICIALTLLCVGYLRKGSYAVSVLELLLAFTVCSYFLYIGRLLPRIAMPAWGYALAMCVAMSGPRWSRHAILSDVACPNDKPSFCRNLALLRDGVGVVLLIASTVMMFGRNLPYFDSKAFVASLSQDSSGMSTPISDYVAAKTDAMFVASIDVIGMYEAEYGYRTLPSEDVASRLISIGGWTTNSPARNEQCRLAGGSSTYEALLRGDTVYFISGETMAKRVLVFLREHYDANVTCERVDDFLGSDSGYGVYRYTCE